MHFSYIVTALRLDPQAARADARPRQTRRTRARLSSLRPRLAHFARRRSSSPSSRISATSSTFYCAARAFAARRRPRAHSRRTLHHHADREYARRRCRSASAASACAKGLFQVFLGELCGVSEAVAVLISSTGYLLTLVWGLIGGVIYMFYRPSEHARLREIKAEVARLRAHASRRRNWRSKPPRRAAPKRADPRNGCSGRSSPRTSR